MQALPEDIAKYRGKYDAGYEPIRRARFEKAGRLGLIDPREPMSPTAKNWDALADKKWEAAAMEVYAAMIERMDRGIGRLVQELKRNGQFENTLILFLQDNGGCAEGMGRRPEKGHPNIPRPDRPAFAPMKPTDLTAAGSVPAQTRDGYPIRMGDRVFPGPADTYIAYGEGWANVSNTPFRRYKHWVHEGGISTPLIAHWPAGIAARGELRREPGHIIDIMATCVELAGGKYPDDAKPLPGQSLVPAFAGRRIDRKAIFWEHEGNRAIREGDWKLVAVKGKPWELYDIETDRVEHEDLSARHPEKVTELSARWNDWAMRSDVVPYPPARPEKK